MDTEILKSFIVLAESESVSQAARKLYIAQSALSNRLKALEKECGATLIERDYHNFKLTACGKQFYERALKLVELAESAVEEIRSAENGLSGTLNIAVTPSLATGVLKEALRRYREAYPGVNVRIYEGITPHMLSRLDEGLCDVALVRSPYTGSPSYNVKTVYRDKMVAVSVEPLKKSMTVGELAGRPLILTYRYASMLERIGKKQGVEFDVPVQCEEIATCVALAESGLGMTIIPYSGFMNHAAHGVKLNASELESAELTTSCDLVYLKNRLLSAAAGNFTDMVFRSKLKCSEAF